MTRKIFYFPFTLECHSQQHRENILNLQSSRLSRPGPSIFTAWVRRRLCIHTTPLQISWNVLNLEMHCLHVSLDCVTPGLGGFLSRQKWELQEELSCRDSAEQAFTDLQQQQHLISPWSWAVPSWNLFYLLGWGLGQHRILAVNMTSNYTETLKIRSFLVVFPTITCPI